MREPGHRPVASSGDSVITVPVGEEKGMPSLHGVQGQGAGQTPSLLVEVVGDRGGGHAEEPDIRGLQEGGKGGGEGVAEDLQDSLGHLALPKHVRLAGESAGLGCGLLGGALYIRELGAGEDPSKGGRQLVAAAGALKGDVVPSCSLDPVDLEAPGDLLPLIGAGANHPHLGHPLEQGLELNKDFLWGG